MLPKTKQFNYFHDYYHKNKDRINKNKRLRCRKFQYRLNIDDKTLYFLKRKDIDTFVKNNIQRIAFDKNNPSQLSVI